MGILERVERDLRLVDAARERFIAPDAIDWSRYELDEEDQAKFKPAYSWTQDLVDFFALPEEAQGALLPWHKTASQVRLRPGEVSLWSGYNGHRKSLLLSHVAIGLLQQQERVCIASLEMPPLRTLARAARQAIGVAEPTPRYVRAWLEQAQNLWLYDHVGTLQARRALAVCRYARDELGCQHVILDSLMKCGMPPDDYGAQKRFIDQLTSYARDAALHIHIVAHSRKGAHEDAAPGKLDVKGASELTDMVDNVFVVWSRKEPEGDKPDVLVACEKQRNGAWLGRIALWFDPESLQFLEHEDSRRYSYVQELQADG